MKTKMTKLEIVKLANHIGRVNGHRGAKFAYALNINQARCMEVQRAVQKIAKPDDTFTEYTNKRLALLEELADKDESGKAKKRSVVAPNGSIGEEYIGADKHPEWNERYNALLKEYDGAIKAQTAMEKEVEELLQEEAEIDLHMVKFADVPETLTREDMQPLMPMILPPVEEK